MKIYTLHREQIVRQPLPRVFEFFSRPENLARITPPAMGFVILTPPPITMEVGTVIDYRLRVAGIPLRWQSLISKYSPPHQFVDEQAVGPYRCWQHRHSFEEMDASCLIVDEVKYALPLGVIGRFAHWLFVGRSLERIFAFRKTAIEKIFVDFD
jgi:ligand-binding SRPBCC domain-containing protein